MKNTLIILSLITSLLVTSQNLIQNPSFEKTIRCAINFDDFNENVFFWSTPTNGTTDLFNNCNLDDLGVPFNFHGRQNSVDGGNYVGCYFLAPEDYREYIQGNFKSKLEKGRKYKISFYINLSDNSVYAIKNIDVILTDKEIKLPIEKVLFLEDLEENIEAKKIDFDVIDYYKDKENWMLLSTEIIADGNENYITIGNFKSNNETEKTKLLKKNFEMAYYYIDNVSVELIEKKNKKPTSKNLDIEIGKKYTFQNIIFRYNSFLLTEESKKEIISVYEFLRNNSNTEIEILGHTDNIGSEKFNLELSKNRAKSVMDFLLKQGLNKKRVSYKGYGSKKPINTNNSEKDRIKNRRVEFIITNQN